jgi:hypothetical protein
LDEDFYGSKRKHGKKDGLNNTTVKYIRNISSMISHAKTVGLVSENHLSIYDKSLKETQVFFNLRKN